MKQIDGITYTNDLKKCSHGKYELQEAKILDSVEVIRKNAFSNSALKKVIFPKNLKIIEEYAFRNSCLEEVIIKKDVIIGKEAFCENPALNKIDVSLLEIPKRCFAYGKASLDINLEFTMVIREGAFKFNNINTLNLPKTLLTIENDAFKEVIFKDTVLKLPNNLTAIGNRVFQGTNLTDLYLPDSLMTIGNYFVDLNTTLHVSPMLLSKIPALKKYKIKTLTIDEILEEEKSFKEINKLYKKIEDTSILH